MYNSNIADEEVKQFHRKVKVNMAYGIEVLTYLDYVSVPNKIFPMFYCDKIEGDSTLRIIDNKLIIYNNNSNLNSLNFISDIDKTPVINIVHKIVTVNNRYFLKLHFYDNGTLLSLKDYQYHLSQTSGVEGDYTVDRYGNNVIELESTSGTFTVTTQDGQTITWSEE